MNRYWCRICKKRKLEKFIAEINVFNGCVCDSCYNKHNEDK